MWVLPRLLHITIFLLGNGLIIWRSFDRSLFLQRPLLQHHIDGAVIVVIGRVVILRVAVIVVAVAIFRLRRRRDDGRPPTFMTSSAIAAPSADVIVKDEAEPEPDAKVARWQNLIPSFPWIAPGWRVWGRNPRKGRDQILQRSVAEP